MRNVLKQFIKIAALLLFFLTPVTFLPALVGGFVAVKAVDIIGGAVDYFRERRVSARANITADERRQRVRAHKENTKKHFFRNGKWNLRELPFDMYTSPWALDKREAYFTCAGIENVIRARVLDRRGRKAEFSIVTESDDKAQQIADHIAENGIIGTRVVRTEDGKFEIVSDNAVDISNIVKEFYPPREMCVEREISTTKQFVVSGCKSYEEARQKFEQNRMFYKPSNVYQTVQDTVEGVKAPEQSSPNIMNPSSLDAGSFIINETKTEKFSRNVKFNGGLDCTDEALRSEASAAYTKQGMSRENDLVEDSTRIEISNGIENDNVPRHVKVNDRVIPLRTAENTDVSALEASLVFRFKTSQEMQDFLSGKVSTAGMPALVDRFPSSHPGEFVVTVPLDNKLLKSMESVDGIPEKIYEKYSDAGVSRKDCQFTSIVDTLSSGEGYATVRLTENVDFSRALVNGVPVNDYAERFENKEKQALLQEIEKDKKRLQWLDDAAKIKAVSVNVDLKNSELVITSTVSNENRSETKVDRRQLTDDELRDFQRRGDIPETDAKDLIMMMHPDYFGTYSADGGRPMYEDPLGSFIRNEKPVAVARQETKSVKQAPAQNVPEQKIEKQRKNEKQQNARKSKKHIRR